MKTMKIYSLACVGALLLGGCSDEQTAPAPDGREVIELSGAPGTGVQTSRALADFPNGGSIGIVASVYDETNLDPRGDVILNWKSYPGILNAAAKATAFNSADQSYSFGWGTGGTEKKYWPFDGGKLAFMAYSPHTSTAEYNLALDTDSMKHLLVSLSPLNVNTPDVMWASNNGNYTPYSKNPITSTPDTYTSPTVQLGEFEHVLSQLTVEVVASADMSPQAQIRVTRLAVMTYKTSGQLDLEDGSLLIPSVVNEQPFTYTLFDQETTFDQQGIRKTVLLLPDTEEVTEVLLELVDRNPATPVYFSHRFAMPQFTNTVDPAKAVILERGKNTTLRFKIEGLNLPGPSDFELKGVISDWNERGKFGVTIN